MWNKIVQLLIENGITSFLDFALFSKDFKDPHIWPKNETSTSWMWDCIYDTYCVSLPGLFNVMSGDDDSCLLSLW